MEAGLMESGGIARVEQASKAAKNQKANHPKGRDAGPKDSEPNKKN